MARYRGEMGRLLTIPIRPNVEHLQRKRISDPRYIDGQRVLVQAIRYLVQSDPQANRAAVELLSEHVRTQFRMTDRPFSPDSNPII